MRRFTAPLVVLLFVAIIAMLAIGMVTGGREGQRSTTTTTSGRLTAAQERAEQVKRNSVILASIPLPPDTRLYTREDAAPPKDGKNATSYAHFASPAGAKAVLEHFRAVLPASGWTLVGELNVDTRSALKFQKGDSWLEVSATDIEVDRKKTPGFTLIVNARDAKAFAAL